MPQHRFHLAQQTVAVITGICASLTETTDLVSATFILSQDAQRIALGRTEISFFRTGRPTTETIPISRPVIGCSGDVWGTLTLTVAPPQHAVVPLPHAQTPLERQDVQDACTLIAARFDSLGGILCTRPAA